MQPLQPMRVDWVATPPPGAYPQPSHRSQRPSYAGPPNYPVTPRWGFPLLAWRWPTAVPGTVEQPDSVDAVRRLGRTAQNSLWLLAAVAVWGAGSEIWRYVLVALSRFGALSSGVVSTSDAMVVSSSAIMITGCFLSLILTMLWVRRARNVAATLVGYGPSRPDRDVLIGLIVPGVNLVVPGSVLAELEHAVARRPAGERPTPSKLLRWWWGLWAGSGLMVVIVVLWSFRSSTQALADGVLLHAFADLLLAAVAVTSALVVRRITTLLLPVDSASVRLMRVVEVKDAPEPPLRSFRASGSPR
ncbi:protein of unknown function [Lentzea albidocapillata subsp. violacea]|uniref:DUF4328 domain-containing protein n=1 Tax=Lentzea albidocapillata subsp. violacea TaxID=128104 RepID=A0A1G9DHA2_9PSEU|nr:DUF4328 domain-containing protein [Lentzea albidocapillata]SDK63174.1 protein of unknown function [Lentzea albidocapillata subsp. violacea]